ncbi:MAG: hypothetical protein FWD96_00020 [Defluviitaleaceae bacterium]|nr:hypothetical protein [Defluviitaleaceae bacterium]
MNTRNIVPIQNGDSKQPLARMFQARSQRESRQRRNLSPSLLQHVTFSVSQEARELAQDTECDFQRQLKEMRAQVDNLRSQWESASVQADAKAEYLRKKLIALEIATRIMNGDEVPTQDHRFLAEFDIALYAKALSLRQPNDDPEKHDSLLEDDEGGSPALVTAEQAPNPSSSDSGAEADTAPPPSST